MNILEWKDIPNLVEKQTLAQKYSRILVSFIAVTNNLNNSQTFFSPALITLGLQVR